MNVVWTDTAKRNLRTIHDNIAQNSPAYAKRMVDGLTSRSKRLERFRSPGASCPSSKSAKSARCSSVLTESSIIFDLITLM